MTRRFFAVGQALGLHHQTVQRCVEKAVAFGPLAALDDSPRPGRERGDHRRSQAMAGWSRLPKSEGAWLSA